MHPLQEELTKSYQAAQLLESDLLEAYKKSAEEEALTILLEDVLAQVRTITDRLKRVSTHTLKDRVATKPSENPFTHCPGM